MTKYWKQIKCMQISHNRYFFVKKIRQNPRTEDILKKFHFPKKTGLSFRILSCTKYDFYGLTINIIQYKIYFSNKHVVVFFLFNNLNDI
jgi:hypothetical protein